MCSARFHVRFACSCLNYCAVLDIFMWWTLCRFRRIRAVAHGGDDGRGDDTKPITSTQSTTDAGLLYARLWTMVTSEAFCAFFHFRFVCPFLTFGVDFTESPAHRGGDGEGDDTKSNSGTGLGTGAKVGIALCVFAGLLVIGIGAYAWRRRRPSKRRENVSLVRRLRDWYF